jgi:hypothetical protein
VLEAISNILSAVEPTPPVPHVAEEAEKILYRAGGQDFETGLRDIYGKSTIYAQSGVVTVNLATLHLVNIKRIQKDLVEHAFYFKYNRQSPSTANLPKLMYTFGDKPPDTTEKF